jgi:hypothetical protein
MTDSIRLSKAIEVWRKLAGWHWANQVARVPARLRLVAEGRVGEGAAAMANDLPLFAILQPQQTATAFGVLAPTLPAEVDATRRRCGEDKPVGIHEIRLASVGNVLECLGFPMPAATWETIRAWLPRFEVSRDDKSVFYFWDAGLIAIAVGDRASARRIAGHRGDDAIPFEPGATFQMNMRGFLHHLAGAVEARATADDVMPAFLELIANYPLYEDGNAAHEATLLWAARVVHHQLGKQPLGTTAQFLHDTIWELAGEPA